MSNNKQVRSDIMSILDDNSKNIPEGVYLELCNKLQKFKFEDKPKPKRYLVIYDSDNEYAGEVEMTEEQEAEMAAAEAAAILREEIEEAEEAAAIIRRNARKETKSSKYVTNPETGRRVLRDGRIGKKLAKQ